MKRIFFLILVLMSFFVIEAQHLTYSDFIKATKYESWSDLSDFVCSKGYTYRGRFYKDQSSQDQYSLNWTKNCDFDGYNYYYPTKSLSSNFSVTVLFGQKTYHYKFTNRAAFNEFISVAKKNGFVSYDESIGENGAINTFYKRKNKSNNKEDMLMFSRLPGDDYYYVSLSRY